MDASVWALTEDNVRMRASDDDWLASIAQGSADETGVPVELLGGYPTLLADAAVNCRRSPRHELGDVRLLGRQAAEQGIGAEQVVDLFLSAAWRLWCGIPPEVRTRDRDCVSAAAEAVLRVVGDAVAVLVDGHQAERRLMIHRDESMRRDLVDDLLRGDSDVASIVERAKPFGLDLSRQHIVAMASPGGRPADSGTAVVLLERAVVDRFGDREVLVADKDDQIVIVVPALTPGVGARSSTGDIGAFVDSALRRIRNGNPWRVAAGRPYPGAYGIARSYEEAREALALAARLRLETTVVYARDLLVYRVLARDHVAIVELVQTVLGRLAQARNGAEPLLATLEAYFESGEVATDAARRLHVSVRTVTYRLAKIATLTGRNPNDPSQRLALHMAVVGARLLRWPERNLSLTP